MLHRASHMWDWSGAVWARLFEHRAEGRLQSLGASIQSPDELEQVLATPEIAFIQMPFNVLDWRWDSLIPRIREAKHQRSLVVHVRSSLLQGLLPSATSEHWHKANVVKPVPVMDWLRGQCREAGRASVADFCLSFVKSLDWVDGVVVGMETLDQLAENIGIFCGADLPDQQVRKISVSRPMLDELSLNPACWRS
jgi:spore coat polysaccharide biosynthesis protein SpsF